MILFIRDQLKLKPDFELLTGPLYLNVTFFMPRPKAHYRTGKYSDELKPSSPHYHEKKPDLDNLVKFIKDCLNGEVWRDDSQVSVLAATKVYLNGQPSTVIDVQII